MPTIERGVSSVWCFHFCEFLAWENFVYSVVFTMITTECSKDIRGPFEYASSFLSTLQLVFVACVPSPPVT